MCDFHAGKLKKEFKLTPPSVSYLLCFHCNNGYANAPQFYVMRTLPVLLDAKLVVRRVTTGL
jgi:hypothetical protein